MSVSYDWHNYERSTIGACSDGENVPIDRDEPLALIKSVALDDVKQFYKDFYGASNGQMIAVGDFDEKEVAALTQELFRKKTKTRGKIYSLVPCFQNF